MFEEIFADSAKDPKEHAETVFKEVPGKVKPPFGSEEWFCFLVDVSTSCASQSIRSYSPRNFALEYASQEQKAFCSEGVSAFLPTLLF